MKKKEAKSHNIQESKGKTGREEKRDMISWGVEIFGCCGGCGACWPEKRSRKKREACIMVRKKTARELMNRRSGRDPPKKGQDIYS